MVLGNTGFDFADQIGPDVRRLGVNAATDARKESDGRRTEGKSGEHGHEFRNRHLIARAEDTRVVDEERTQPEQTEANHAHAHDRSAVEGNAERLIQPGARGFGCADIGFRRDAHTDETSESGADRTGDERESDERTGFCFRGPLPSEQGCDDHDETGQHAVFGFEEGHCAFLNEAADALHLLVAGRLTRDPAGAEEREEQGQKTRDRKKIDKLVHGKNLCG